MKLSSQPPYAGAAVSGSPISSPIKANWANLRSPVHSPATTAGRQTFTFTGSQQTFSSPQTHQQLVAQPHPLYFDEAASFGTPLSTAKAPEALKQDVPSGQVGVAVDLGMISSPSQRDSETGGIISPGHRRTNTWAPGSGNAGVYGPKHQPDVRLHVSCLPAVCEQRKHKMAHIVRLLCHAVQCNSKT